MHDTTNDKTGPSPQLAARRSTVSAGAWRESRASAARASAHRALIVVGALLAVLIFALGAASAAGWLERPSRALNDARFALATRAPVTPSVLVAIDAASLSAIDVWPWPRARHAELIDRLNAMGAAEIHFDVDFSSPSNATDDRALSNALAASDAPVTLAAHAQATSAGMVERLPLPAFADHAGMASVVVHAGADGLVRHAERGRLLNGVPTPSLASLVAGLPPAPGAFAIDYSIDPAAVPVLSFADVLAGTVDSGVVRGARVVVGATAVELGDMLATPHWGVLPGALVQVLAGETLAQDRVARAVPHALPVGLGAVLLLGVGLLGAMARRGTLDVGPALLVIATAAGALALADIHLFTVHARVLPSVELGAGLVALGLIVLGAEIVRRRARELAEARRAEKVARVLDRVVADNFDGIIVFAENAHVLSVSAVARRQMRELFGLTIDGTLPPSLPGSLRARLLRPAVLLREGRWVARPPESYRCTDVTGRERHLEYTLTPSFTRSSTRSVVAPRASGAGEEAHGAIVTTLTMRDVTERVASRARMDWLARHDEPTGALKPLALSALIDAPDGETDDARLSDEGTGGGTGGALVAFDLRRFAVLRRTLGRGRSDALLAGVVAAIDALPAARGVARTADGEFVAWMADRDVMRAASEVRAAVREGLGATGSTVRMALPTGVLPLGAANGVLPAGGGRPAGRDAIEAAVTAKEVAVRRGDAIVLHEPAMDETARRRLAIEAGLPAAIASGGTPGGLSVAYQPQIDLATGRVLGVEALTRWVHPELGFVPPDEFIEVAETGGRIAELGAWILERACTDMAALNEERGTPLRVAVNVSPQQFVQSDVGAAVTRALVASNLPARHLELEITESLAVGDPATVTETLAPWRARGLRVALDDFGTGYAQLGALGALPIDKIKLDRSLVAPLPGIHATSLVAAALTIAGGHGLLTVAEGIEDERVATLLRGAGCHIGQGYHWSRPLALGALREWLAERESMAATG